jgi:DNA topoisomerase IB
MTRLHRSNPHSPGLVRRRRGRSFSYTDADGSAVDDETLERIRALAIPPAWVDVWICSSPNGHIQAVGTDAAGRRQYRYHDTWRRRRDRQKFAHALELGEVLPTARARVTRHLNGRGLTRSRVLAASFRLLDTGAFRIGSEQYAVNDGSVGLATLRCEHVHLGRESVEFDYIGKGGKRQSLAVSDAQVLRALRPLARRPPNAELLAWRVDDGWRDVKSSDINAYIRQVTGGEFTAKDFRTWRATVVAAQALARGGVVRSESGARRAIKAAMQEVADVLGNTPAIARSSYVDPRVLDHYRAAETIDPSSGGIESAVRSLLQA